MRPGVKEAMNISTPSCDILEVVFSESGILLLLITEKSDSGWMLVSSSYELLGPEWLSSISCSAV